MATLGGILGGKQFLEYTDNPLKVPPQTVVGISASPMSNLNQLPTSHKTQSIE
ncbi:hypothetical protein RBSWK_03571 [Rhodopirellula baltica SWK14]|uniref:Uncharacterized protein n=1 Tax=Rhodopirellula baltica SWK14 TaxID=993516 RepID=L7CDY6_RHOBT|nr:hypothetical protein RBSWK_03571 [Rhodopirellula baltica SWK14]